MPQTFVILTPLKNAARHLDRYFENIASLEQDPSKLSLGFLVSDSDDGTLEALLNRREELEKTYRNITILEKNFDFSIPDGFHRWANAIQAPRRIVLAKSRNHLLFAALRDEDWAVWLDVDVSWFPPDVLTRMVATGKSIVHPNCVIELGGQAYDGNAWRQDGTLFMHGMRSHDLVRLEGIGGTMILIKADIHRDGLVFPAFPYGVRSPYSRTRNEVVGIGGGESETEGLAIMAKDMGHETWGMPNLEILHLPE